MELPKREIIIKIRYFSTKIAEYRPEYFALSNNAQVKTSTTGN